MNSDLIELLQLLKDHKVRYLIIGGQAVILHSEPRFTKDTDLWVEPSPKNAARLFLALQEFGAPTSSITEEDLATPGTVFIFGLPPNRIDILTRVKGALFGKCFKNRLGVKIKGVSANFISLDDLIRVKRATGRPQDMIDLERLLMVKQINRESVKSVSKRQKRKSSRSKP